MKIITVELKELAEIYRKDERTIQLWDEENKAKYGTARLEKGKYNLVKFVTNRNNFLVEQLEIAKNSGDEKLHDLKIEGQKTANKLADLKLRQLSKNLISYDAARLAWLDETVVFRNNTLALIPKLYTALHIIDEKQKEKIVELVHEVLTMLGDFKPEAIDEEEETSLISEVEQINQEPIE